MFRSYFKIAWRNLWKDKMTTSLSLFGLLIGIICFLLLGTYVLNEFRYDQYHNNSDRIVYVNYNYKSPSDDEAVCTPLTPTAVAPVAKRNFDEVEDAVRIYTYDQREVEVNTEHFTEREMILADESIFNIFSFSFISGDPTTALTQPYSLVLTKSTANKYFAAESALGKSIIINDKNWKITGVVSDNLPYSSIQFDLLGSYSSSARAQREVWNSANDHSYLLLKNPDQKSQLERKYNAYLQEEFKEGFQDGFRLWLDFVPLQQVHLSELVSGNLKTYLYILSIIAVLLLSIGAINFTNLMTAKSVDRLREIGVRKVMGAKRSSLMLQFLTEAAIITFIALSMGIVLAIVLIPSFNRITHLSISTTSWDEVYFSVVILSLFVAITLLSGLWPAWVLSRFKTVKALKNGQMTLESNTILRKALVVFQFTVSIAFIIATLVVQKQLNFIQETDTGFNRSNIVMLEANSMTTDQVEDFKRKLLNSPYINHVTASSHSPVSMQGGYNITVSNQKSGMSITAAPVDQDFLTTMNIPLVAGSNFTNTDKLQVQRPEEERIYAFMLNETATNRLGYSAENAIGKRVNLNGREGFIKGVVKDFNFVSLHKSIAPVALFVEYDWFGKIIIKTQPQTIQSIAAIEEVWKQSYPDHTFTYAFLDTEYDQLYKTEKRTATILNLFAAITIAVSCLGLLGLSVFMAAQRRKEIGIRKVLGASVIQLTYMLSINFLKLVGIALCLAIPLAWYTTKQWLENFAYRIELPFELYVLSGFIAITIAGLTVSIQAIKSALSNPTDSLQSE